MAKERETKASKNEPTLSRRENVLPSSGMPLGMPLLSPFGMMRRFLEEFDRIGSGAEPVWSPALEVFEQNGELVVRAEVPGLTKDQVNIEAAGDQLVISGERSRENEERREGVYRSERSYGSFCRIVTLPQGVDPEKAEATFDNGVLEIRMPAPERSKTKRIEIREGSGARTQTSATQTSASQSQTSPSQPSAPQANATAPY